MTEISSPDGRAVFTDGHWEIPTDLVGDQVPLPRQQMNLGERNRIIAQRLRYLDFVHDHFADSVTPPPSGYDVVEPAIDVEH